MNIAAKDLGDAMPWFDTWCSMAGNLAKFLRRRWTREWFLGTCVDTPAAAPFMKLMQTFNGDLPSWRFGE
eukprot:5372875-Alexandrium_andersonii.AAC.1